MSCRVYFLTFLLALSFTVSAQDHPSLIITQKSVPELQAAIEKYSLWKQDVGALKAKVDAAMEKGIDVPIPVDPAGGYTHGQHKKNAQLIKNLGTAYLVLNDEKYAKHAKELFLEYAKMYPTLGEHPVKKSYAPGKLFWQQLNEAVWMVDAIQGYDAIYDYLTAEERKTIEKDLLLPFADFLSIENTKVFNRIHNHGVWAVAAVGMTGIALKNNELICRALYGINEKGKANYSKIDKEKLLAYEAGFFVQTSSLFSPDGYYTEGPYYQRYAMTPFLLFAQSMHNNIPEVEALKFGDEVFFKAVETLIDLADAKGRLLPINDNLKGMSLDAPSIIWAVNFLYANTKNKQLLSIASNHNYRLVNSLGLEVVLGLSYNLQEPLKQMSKLITDGSNGKAGGILLLHDSDNEFCTVFKFASQGLTHGHYDRLNLFHYQDGEEVLTDYGAARFVNIKAKEGGRYLPENKSYAKHTIAHNTVVVNQKSHFNYKYKVASKHNPELVFSEISNVKEQVVCARDTNAYPEINLTRVVAQIDNENFVNPIIVDLFKITAKDTAKTYDLPFHFTGEIIDTDFDYKANSTSLSPLGKNNGYEHLWLTAKGKSENNTASLTWLNNFKLYSLTTVNSYNTDLLIAKIGANDPNYNLRNEPVFIARKHNVKNHVFASVLESHGVQNPDTEFVSNQVKQVKDLSLYNVGENYLALTITSTTDAKITVLIALESKKVNKVEINGETHSWEGSYKIITQ